MVSALMLMNIHYLFSAAPFDFPILNFCRSETVMWTSCFRNANCCTISFVTKWDLDVESRNVLTEIDSPNFEISSTLAIANNTVLLVIVVNLRHFLIFTLDLQRCSRFILAGLRSRELNSANSMEKLIMLSLAVSISNNWWPI